MCAVFLFDYATGCEAYSFIIIIIIIIILWQMDMGSLTCSNVGVCRTREGAQQSAGITNFLLLSLFTLRALSLAPCNFLSFLCVIIITSRNVDDTDVLSLCLYCIYLNVQLRKSMLGLLAPNPHGTPDLLFHPSWCHLCRIQSTLTQWCGSRKMTLQTLNFTFPWRRTTLERCAFFSLLGQMLHILVDS